MDETPHHSKPEQSNGPERTHSTYYLAVRFADEQVSMVSYAQAQETIYAATQDLSVYRFLLDGVFHVTVLGIQPSPELELKLQTILAPGEPTPLPDEIVALLTARRAQLSRHGSWIEGHYRPGTHTNRRPKK